MGRQWSSPKVPSFPASFPTIPASVPIHMLHEVQCGLTYLHSVPVNYCEMRFARPLETCIVAGAVRRVPALPALIHATLLRPQ